MHGFFDCESHPNKVEWQSSLSPADTTGCMFIWRGRVAGDATMGKITIRIRTCRVQRQAPILYVFFGPCETYPKLTMTRRRRTWYGLCCLPRAVELMLMAQHRFAMDENHRVKATILAALLTSLILTASSDIYTSRLSLARPSRTYRSTVHGINIRTSSSMYAPTQILLSQRKLAQAVIAKVVRVLPLSFPTSVCHLAPPPRGNVYVLLRKRNPRDNQESSSGFDAVCSLLRGQLQRRTTTSAAAAVRNSVRKRQQPMDYNVHSPVSDLRQQLWIIYHM